MKKLLLTMGTGCLLMSAFPQTPASSGTQSLRYYFPAVYYDDSVGFNKAIPTLAAQITAAYSDPNRRTFLENSVVYDLLSGNYERATNRIDSIRKIDGDNSYSIDIKSYALAKIAEKRNKDSFESAFKKEFSNAFSNLSFRKKVSAALFDSSAVNYLATDYMSIKEKLKKNNKDTLTLEDARSLADKFANYSIYKTISPLMSSAIGAEYKETFPAIKKPAWAGVVPVRGIDEVPDPTIDYNLLFELTGFALKGQDSSAKKDINGGLAEVARQINLHEAAGIPRKNIHAVIVAHAMALDAFLVNEKYKKKYGLDNPNIPLITELQDYGVKIIVCGQAMTFFRLEQEDLVPRIRLALTAQTVLSSYQLKNYVHYDLSLRE